MAMTRKEKFLYFLLDWLLMSSDQLNALANAAASVEPLMKKTVFLPKPPLAKAVSSGVLMDPGRTDIVIPNPLSAIGPQRLVR